MYSEKYHWQKTSRFVGEVGGKKSFLTSLNLGVTCKLADGKGLKERPDSYIISIAVIFSSIGVHSISRSALILFFDFEL